MSEKRASYQTIDELMLARARKIAAVLVEGEQEWFMKQPTLENLETAKRFVASNLGLASLAISDKKQLLSGETRLEIAAEAINAAGWQEILNSEKTQADSNVLPLPDPGVLLVASTDQPGYYALGKSNGRMLVQSDLVSIQVSEYTWIDAVIHQSRKPNDPGSYSVKSLKQQGYGHYALTTDGTVLGLCSGMCIRLREREAR